MKKFKLTIDGNIFEVSVDERDKNVAEVIVDGKPYTVEFTREDVSLAANQVRKQPVQKTSNTAAPAKKASSAPAPAVKKVGSSKSVNSPLPGNIFKILVSVGQEVKRGEQLIIIESMKMENSITADRDGTVKAIHIEVGQSVLQGDALVDLD